MVLFAVLLGAHPAGGPSASAAGTTERAAGYWIVLASDRDGETRAYDIRPDGSRLTPLLPRGRGFTQPAAVSRDGKTIVYVDPFEGAHAGIYVSRANGTGLRRLVRNGGSPALSPDGKRVAFTFGNPPHVAVIGTNGRGRRRLTSGYDQTPDWSPNGKAVVFTRSLPRSDIAVVVQPLRGRQRVLVRDEGIGSPKWSADGRWIAYVRFVGNNARNGLYVVHPNGARRHRVARGFAYPFEWSPDGRRLAYGFGYPKDVALVAVNGRRPRRLHLRRLVSTSALTWSPDGRRLILAGPVTGGRGSSQIWTVGLDGRGLRRVTSDVGGYDLVGWTRLSPVLPPAPPLLPSERVIDARTVATGRPIADLSADGSSVAFVVKWTAADCDHVAVWTPTTQALERFGSPVPCPVPSESASVYDVELAGSRAAWVSRGACGNFCDFTLESATLARDPVDLAVKNAENSSQWDYHLRGDGDVLVFNDDSRLVRIGTGSEACQEPGNPPSRICATLRRGAHAAAADSVSGRLIAVREADAVAVVDEQGSLVRVFPFAPQQVRAARLDGDRLVVARSGVLEVYDVTTGVGLLQRPLPTGYRLADVDGGIAVLLGADTVMLLRLDDGHSSTLTPGRGPVFAELEPPGLYYSYATDDGSGRLVFVPRSELPPLLVEP
jgi:Tol biopolymer transport system component